MEQSERSGLVPAIQSLTSLRSKIVGFMVANSVLQLC